MAYIQLDRKYFNGFLWNEERVYSKAEAWLDLIQMARFEAKKEMINNRVIEVQRGELPASNRFLQLRWNWSNSKVSNFVKTLVQQGMITSQNDRGITIISLCKYDEYNKIDNSENDTEATLKRQQGDTEATLKRQKKELKKEKELKKNNPPLPPKGKGDEKLFELISDDWRDLVVEWLEYKSARKQKYKTAKSLKAFEDELRELSGGDKLIAKKIIKKSMASNWSGIFPLKNNNNGKNNSRKSKSSDPHSREFGEAVAEGIAMGFSECEEKQQ